MLICNATCFKFECLFLRHVVPDQDCPCLLAICRDSAGEITGGQMTYINTRTLRKAKHVQVDKRSVGNVMQSFVCLQKGTNHTGDKTPRTPLHERAHLYIF